MAEPQDGIPIPVNRDSTLNPSWTATVPAAPVNSSPVTAPEPNSTAPQAGPPPLVPVSQPVAQKTSENSLPNPQVSSLESQMVPQAPSTSVPPIAPTPVIPTTQPRAQDLPPVELAIAPSHPDRAPRWRPILLTVIALILVGVIGFVLWWLGIGFGAPRSPQVALLSMSQAFGAVTSYHTEGSMSLSISSGTSTSTTTTATRSTGLWSLFPTVLAAAADDGVDAIPVFPDTPTTYGISLKFTGDLAGIDQSQSTISADLSGLGESLPATFPSTVEMDFRQVGGTYYIRLPILSLLVGSDSNKWLAFDSSDLTSPEAEQLADGLPYKDLSNLLANASRLGFERIGPVNTAHYQAEIALNDLLELFDLSDDASTNGVTATSNPITFEWWMGVNNHLPYRIKINAEAAVEGAIFTIGMDTQYSQFGDSFAVTAPDPADISTDGLSGILGDYGDVELKARDTQRKSDLAAVKSALALYKNDYGSYPSTDGVIARTDDPTSPLAELVTKGYVSALPVDPLADIYWYGYNSTDGVTYELWSVLEDAADPQGTLRAGVTIYVVTPTK